MLLVHGLRNLLRLRQLCQAATFTATLTAATLTLTAATLTAGVVGMRRH